MSGFENSTPMTSGHLKLILNSMSEHWFKTGILTCFLLLTLSAAYYFVIWLPARDSERDICLAKADSDYHKDWAAACTQFGQTSVGPLCTLPAYNADRVEGWRREAKEKCFRQY